MKFNKKYMLFGLFGMLALTLVSAGLVMYYSQQQINMNIESPIILLGELSEQVTLVAGDGYELYLVEGENRLDRDVDVNIMFSLLDGDGNALGDTNGFYLAYSEDIQYAYNPIYGAATNWEEAQTWMNANLDWFDWYLTGALVDYDASIITNHGGNSAYANVIPFNTAIPQALSPGEFKAVVYLDIDEGVIPGAYTLSIDVIPTA